MHTFFSLNFRLTTLITHKTPGKVLNIGKSNSFYSYLHLNSYKIALKSRFHLPVCSHFKTTQSRQKFFIHACVVSVLWRHTLAVDLCAAADLQLSHHWKTGASRHQMSTETSQPPPIAVSQVLAGANLFQTASVQLRQSGMVWLLNCNHCYQLELI